MPIIRLLSILFALATVGLLAACGGSVTMEDSRLFEFAKSGFRELSPDYGQEVFSSHISTELAGVPFDDAWTAALETVSQRGVIVRADHRSGVIVVMSGPLKVPRYQTKYAVSVAGATASAVIGIKSKGSKGSQIYLLWKEDLINSNASASEWTISEFGEAERFNRTHLRYCRIGIMAIQVEILECQRLNNGNYLLVAVRLEELVAHGIALYA